MATAERAVTYPIPAVTAKRTGSLLSCWHGYTGRERVFRSSRSLAFEFTNILNRLLPLYMRLRTSSTVTRIVRNPEPHAGGRLPAPGFQPFSSSSTRGVKPEWGGPDPGWRVRHGLWDSNPGWGRPAKVGGYPPYRHPILPTRIDHQINLEKLAQTDCW